MNRKISLMLMCVCLFTISAISQSRKEYDKAELLAIEANKQLLAGEVKIADSLINESINLYPTKAIFEYAKSFCRLSDMATANAIMDKAYSKVETFSSRNIYVVERIPLRTRKWGKELEVKEFERARALFLFGYEAYLVNKEFGDSKRNERILEKLVKLKFSKLAKYDLDYSQLEYFTVELAIAKKDFEKAISFINSLSQMEAVRLYYLSIVYFEKGDYDNALKSIESSNTSLKGGFIAQVLLLKFKIYALQGKNDDALDNYNKYMDRQNPVVFNELFYYLAIVDLNKQDYKAALGNLDSTLNYRTKLIIGEAEATLVDRWKVFKLLGDAYAGLEQYEKAKDNYNIALLSNPDYEPAVTALVNLETTIANNTSTDKTAPAISLLEPAPSRGFKVTAAGANVLIKGIATDPSGLKEVKINNKIVYAQKGGDFWGEVVLAEGINKVTVTATDFAGNKGEQVFEIERQTAKANTDIIPVVEKEGRNYCLLIAAQNYSDNNIPSLTNPVADAVKLKLIFKDKYNFNEENIITLFNPEGNDVKRQLLELTNLLQPEDNLVIFYAGHGIWVEKEKKGYWLLTEAKRNDVNTWLPNKTVLELIAKIPSRHTLLITDACFSGSVFKTRGLGKDAPAAMKEMDEKISRVAITSGNDTEVPDESVFMKYLVKALSENKEKYLTAQKMFITQIIEAVMTETKTEPRYGTLELAGHVGGDYIFSKK